MYVLQLPAAHLWEGGGWERFLSSPCTAMLVVVVAEMLCYVLLFKLHSWTSEVEQEQTIHLGCKVPLLRVFVSLNA